MKNHFKSVKKLSLVVVLGSLTLFISCGNDENEDCLGCDSDAPYSTPGASSCYETLSDCASALGSGCTRCD